MYILRVFIIYPQMMWKIIIFISLRKGVLETLILLMANQSLSRVQSESKVPAVLN